MQQEKIKASRITKELLSYFLEHNLNQFTADFNITETSFSLTIDAPCPVEPVNFSKFIEDLNTPRAEDIDEYFNALLGNNSHQHDYTFLGKSLDEAQGHFNPDTQTLHLTVVRHFDHL